MEKTHLVAAEACFQIHYSTFDVFQNIVDRFLANYFCRKKGFGNRAAVMAKDIYDIAE